MYPLLKEINIVSSINKQKSKIKSFLNCMKRNFSLFRIVKKKENIHIVLFLWNLSAANDWLWHFLWCFELKVKSSFGKVDNRLETFQNQYHCFAHDIAFHLSFDVFEPNGGWRKLRVAISTSIVPPFAPVY